MEAVDEYYQNEHLGQPTEASPLPDGTAFLPNADSPEGPHLPEIQTQQHLMMSGQPLGPAMQMQMLAGAPPAHQQQLPSYFQPMPQMAPYMRNQAGTPDDFGAPGDSQHALQRFMNFDLSQPIARSVHLNSDIDYDTNQLLRAGTGDLLPAQRRRANMSMQATGSQKALRMKQ